MTHPSVRAPLDDGLARVHPDVDREEPAEQGTPFQHEKEAHDDVEGGPRDRVAIGQRRHKSGLPAAPPGDLQLRARSAAQCARTVTDTRRYAGATAVARKTSVSNSCGAKGGVLQSQA